MALYPSTLLLRSPPPPTPPPKPYLKTLIPNTIAIAPARVGAATPRNTFSTPSAPNRRGASASASASASSSWAAGDLRPAIDENPEGIISGEWPENFSLLSYDDLRAYLESQIISSDKIRAVFSSAGPKCPSYTKALRVFPRPTLPALRYLLSLGQEYFFSEYQLLNSPSDSFQNLLKNKSQEKKEKKLRRFSDLGEKL